MDIDECMMMEAMDKCKMMGKECANTNGSYYCSPQCEMGMGYNSYYKDCRGKCTHPVRKGRLALLIMSTLLATSSFIQVWYLVVLTALVKPQPPRLALTFMDTGEYTLTIIADRPMMGFKYNIRVMVHQDMMMKYKVDLGQPYKLMVASKHVS